MIVTTTAVAQSSATIAIIKITRVISRPLSSFSATETVDDGVIDSVSETISSSKEVYSTISDDSSVTFDDVVVGFLLLVAVSAFLSAA